MKTLTFKEFEERVSECWGRDEYTYSSRGIAARQAQTELENEGVTNTEELWEQLKKKYKDMLFYAGD